VRSEVWRLNPLDALCPFGKKGEPMNSYLVRIYRRSENDPNILVGVVREIGTGEKKPFNTRDELWSILNPVEKGPMKQKRGRSPRRNPDGNGS